MNVRFKNISNSENKTGKTPIGEAFPSPSVLSSQNLSFKGSYVNNISGAVDEFGKRFGPSAQKYMEEQIKLLRGKENPFITFVDNKIIFKKITLLGRINQSIIDPILNMPIDLTNLTLKLLKKTRIFKNSTFINNLLEKGVLKNRKDYLERVSHAAGIEHYFEMLEDNKLKSEIFNEGHKRLSTKLSNYSTKAERSLTRFVTGIIPAFFLAKDAYNLSIYVNNDKDLANKEKKRRFKQEAARITITAAATFAFLSYFAKKSNSTHDNATTLIAILTFASEIIGRIIAGTPFYPINEKQAKKYAKLQHKDKLANNDSEIQEINSPSTTHKSEKIEFNKPQKYQVKINKKEDSKQIDILNILGGLVIFGFAVEQLTKKGSRIGTSLEKMTKEYKTKFKQDIFMPQKEIEELILQLRKNGFGPMADNYEKILAKLPVSKENKELIKIGSETNKYKDIILNQILALPIKFAWEVLMMPYKGVVKPIFELSKNGLGKLKIISPEVEKTMDKKMTEEEIFENGIKFLKKMSKKPNFKNKVNKNLLESFDNVNKSNFSNAELSGAAKTAVSTVTSAFLIADNYNLVMIDSQGKKKDLAQQKAKERTIQRIARIAYGTTLIKLFNGIFSKQYNSGLLGAQAVNVLSTGVVETLERKSVGLPLTESTKEDIIKNDEKNMNAKGFKGAYHRFMSKLTGKKSIAEMKVKEPGKT